ncbi:MAG TPA: hypothetical protein VGC13_06805 [Longimicrobium sp.]|jgi:hypothetical protein|uniref:hypothetical protein n=1 Tax=Longimicrobium sp. TaxID=2029185 RepID=UPI002EDA9DA4
MRTINDDHGRPWEAIAIPTKVAHLRDGAQLAFRGEAGATVTAPIDFNSLDAAGFAIRTMSEKELRRRLEWAKTAAGVV